MRVCEMNWMQLEAYLERDDRAVIPLGSTEQHGYLSLCVDNILPERLAAEVAEPLGVPVFPTLNYGITPYFAAYPGSVSLRVETYLRVLRDILDSLARSGFRRFLLVNGHGGNSPAQGLVAEWTAEHPDCQVLFHNWWNAPRAWQEVQRIDPVASHASWMENFPWTRLTGVQLPDIQKPMTDLDRLRLLAPARLRETLGDGNYGGLYQRPDEDMQALWNAAVQETRDLLQHGWLPQPDAAAQERA